MLEDRVITTDQLADANAGIGPYLQIGAGVLQRLDPVGLHVLVPRGPVPASEGEVLCCDAQLRLAGETEPLTVPVLVAVDVFVELPTTFEALGVAAALVPSMVVGVEQLAG